MISVEVSERTPTKGGSVPMIGTHLYRVRVHNESDQAITIDSIRLEVTNGGDVHLQNAMQSVRKTLEPTESREFDLWVTAAPSGAPSSFARSIESLRVALACRVGSSAFVDSNVYQVLPE
jgi:hypothetical protein